VETRFTPSEKQHDHLLKHLAKLVGAKGDKGIIYLNDLEPAATAEVAQVVSEYAKKNGWTNLQVIEYPGDYTKVDVPRTTSARISHPESSFFNAPSLLRRMAEGSETGLEIITHYNRKISRMHQDGASDLLLLKLDREARYLFPSGRQVKTDASNTRRYFVTSSRIPLVLDQDFVSITVLPEGTKLYGWGTERRAQRLLGDQQTVVFGDECYAKLRPREMALLGPGAYCSANPTSYLGHGTELLVFDFVAPTRFLRVAQENLQRFHTYLQRLGYKGGLNDNRWQSEVAAAGYHGIISSDAPGVDIQEAVIITGNQRIMLHRGRDFLLTLQPQSILTHPFGREVVTALRYLGESAMIARLKREAGIPEGKEFEPLFHDDRTVYQKLKPIVDSFVRRVFGGRKSALSRFVKSFGRRAQR
jgi:hypothetical protein